MARGPGAGTGHCEPEGHGGHNYHAPVDRPVHRRKEPGMTAPTLEVAAHLNSEEMPWAELAPGIEAKLLRVSEQTGTYVLMNRFAPGTVLPTHRHMGTVHAFTIQGRWRYREYDWVATAGSFAFEPAGATHTLTAEGEEDTVVLFVIEGGLIVFDDDG